MSTDPSEIPAAAAPILRSLPGQANLEQLRKQAKDLLHQHSQQQPECCAILRWLNRFALSQDVQIFASGVALHEAQDAIAMSYGFRNWQTLHEWVERGPDWADAPALGFQEISGWQSALDRLARLAGVPIAIFQRIDGPFAEVIADNGAADNPLEVGDKRRWQGAGLYFEMVVKTLAPLVVPNAREDETWKDCPLIELGLVSCAGIPVAGPDGMVFGVLSLLARDPHPYPEHVLHALGATQALLESQLRQRTQLRRLEARIQQLSDLLLAQRTIRDIVTMCSYCKRVRDSAGQWQEIEEMLLERTGAQTSHSICPGCVQQNYMDQTSAPRS